MGEFSASFQSEFFSLQQETDPELYSQGMLVLGKRLEASNQYQEAAEVYARVLGQPADPQPPAVAEAGRQAQKISTL